MVDEMAYLHTLQLGGPGVIVEMDESKFGKRKYNRGHRVEGNWVWGCIERLVDPNTGNCYAGRCVMIVVPNRTISCLRPLIERFIKPGTYIISDKYSTYFGVSEYESSYPVMSDQEYRHHYGYLGNGKPNPFGNKKYLHDMVNHSETYKDPITGAHTNTIEGSWRVAKSRIPKRVYGQTAVLQEYLFEQAWESCRRTVGCFFGMVDSMKFVRI
jgi:hypothetical protein